MIFLSFLSVFSFTFEQVERGCIKFYKVVDGIITNTVFLSIKCFYFKQTIRFLTYFYSEFQTCLSCFKTSLERNYNAAQFLGRRFRFLVLHQAIWLALARHASYVTTSSKSNDVAESSPLDESSRSRKAQGGLVSTTLPELRSATLSSGRI